MKRKLMIIFLLIGIMAMSSASAERVWEDMGMQLPNGDSMWATLDKGTNCYTLQVGVPSDTRIYGDAKNCGDDINGYWAVYACRTGSEGVEGGIGEVIENVLQRCQ